MIRQTGPILGTGEPARVILCDTNGIPYVVAGGGTTIDVDIVGAERATTGAQVGVTVSTAAVQILASNANAKNRAIVNNGTTNIYLGSSAAVTTSGATMGIKLIPNGTYTDSGLDMYTGAIFGIGDAVSASQNVSAWERS